MIRIRFSVALQYAVSSPGADFIFNVQAAHTRQQRVVSEHLTVNQAVMLQSHTDVPSRARYLRLSAQPGLLELHSSAVVDLHHHIARPEHLAEVPVRQLPPQVLPYLYPSRYCESDHLGALAMQEFGRLWQGHQRVIAIRDWVQRRVVFRGNTSTSTTTARDTLASGAGVCRDFAHVMIALCRALNIPARFVTGFDYGADPALGPPDFHAYVEVYLGGRWYLFDPSGTAIPMAFVRLATGRDASDSAFATIFGPVASQSPVIRIEALPDDRGVLQLPQHTTDALSTDDGAP
jgi:transglutaminase-like putative cysteine protease